MSFDLPRASQKAAKDRRGRHEGILERLGRRRGFRPAFRNSGIPRARVGEGGSETDRANSSRTIHSEVGSRRSPRPLPSPPLSLSAGAKLRTNLKIGCTATGWNSLAPYLYLCRRGILRNDTDVGFDAAKFRDKSRVRTFRFRWPSALYYLLELSSKRERFLRFAARPEKAEGRGLAKQPPQDGRSNDVPIPATPSHASFSPLPIRARPKGGNSSPFSRSCLRSGRRSSL